MINITLYEPLAQSVEQVAHIIDSLQRQLARKTEGVSSIKMRIANLNRVNHK